jgi:hypothetical protein
MWWIDGLMNGWMNFDGENHDSVRLLSILTSSTAKYRAFVGLSALYCAGISYNQFISTLANHLLAASVITAIFRCTVVRFVAVWLVVTNPLS